MLKALQDVWANRDLRIATITLFCLGFTFASTLPYQSIIATEQLGFSTRQFGLILLATAVAGTVAGLLVGHFSDQARDRKQAVLISLALGAAGFGAFALAPSRATFLVCLLVIVPISGSAFSQLFAIIRSLNATSSAADAASINSVVRAVFAASWIVVPGLVGAFIAYREHVSDSFGIAALAYLFCFALYAMLGPSGGAAEPPALSRWVGLQQAAKLVASSHIFKRVLALGMIGSAHALNGALAPLLVTEMPGGTTRDVGILAGLKAGLEIPFMLLAGMACRRWNLWVVIVVGGLCDMAYFTLLAFSFALWQVYALSVLNAMGAAVALSLYVTYLQELLPDRPGLGTSLVSIEQLFQRGFGAALFAMISLLGGLSGTLLAGAATIALGCVLLVRLDAAIEGRRMPS